MARFRSDDWIGAQIDKAAEARETVGITAKDVEVAHEIALKHCKARCVELVAERDKLQTELEKYYPYTTSELGETIDKLEEERDRLRGVVGTLLDTISKRNDRNLELHSDLARLRARNSKLEEELEMCRVMTYNADAPASGETLKQYRNAEELAKQFHDLYERFAPLYNYKTREKTAVAWEDVPDNNKGLMVAVANAILYPGAKPCTVSKAEASVPLEPCPACGETDIVLSHRGIRDDDGRCKLDTWYWHTCANYDCNMRGPRCKTKSAARAAWNGLCNKISPFMVCNYLNETDGIPIDYVFDREKGEHYYKFPLTEILDNRRLAERVRELIKMGVLYQAQQDPKKSAWDDWLIKSESDLLKEAPK